VSEPKGDAVKGDAVKNDAVVAPKTTPLTNRGRRAWKILRACALLLIVWALLAWVAARSLIVRAELAHADALVVLSGSSEYVERTRWAAQLFREGRAPLVVLTDDNQRSGWSSEQQRNPYFVERAFEELRRADVPAEKIVVVPLPQPASSTYDESLTLRDYATARGLRSLLVVTSPYHSRRALWTLRRVFRGSDVAVGLDPVAAGQQSPAPVAWWLDRRGWQTVAAEYPKLIYYWLRY
jgi:uncharacterized SAM-binding protein YcdF (DUF218 family)